LRFVKTFLLVFAKIYYRLEKSQEGGQNMIMTQESMAERLKRLREARGLSKYRLARLSGISEAYLSQLESGVVANPRGDTLKSLAKGLNISVSELTGEIRHSPEEALSEIEVSIKAYIPVYAEVSAGLGIEPVDYVAVTRSRPAPETLRAYRVKGLCLDPEIKEGDTVIVDTSLLPQHGDLVIVLIDGQASIKYYKEDETGNKWLENHYGKFQPKDVHIHGVVTEFNRKRR
jgi:transcriptional regulator with XRE-family HTH domain